MRIVESLTIIAITTVGLELVKELTELLKSDMEENEEGTLGDDGGTAESL